MSGDGEGQGEGRDANRVYLRLTPAMAMKHGFESVEEYKKGVQKKFSLLETGIIQQPSTRLLLINVSFGI